MDLAAADLTARWEAAWGECRPVSYELRGCRPDRWVRFHSLPGSQRYAADEVQHAEILRRHQTALAELLQGSAGDEGDDLLVFTASWSDSPEPAERETQVADLMPAVYWSSVLQDGSDPEWPVWVHLWASAATLHSAELRQLLLLAADYATAGVIVTTPAMAWLYAPYDGGADVIAATSEQRDKLRRMHQDWLSAHPSGL